MLSSPRIDAPFPRLLIGAASSGSGKTTLALGIVAALKRRGCVVAAAKVGPDFIDAAHLRRVSGRPARNLDAFLASPDAVIGSFARGSAGADVSVIEGVMGLFDGRHGSGEGSTAHVARILDAPVVLVLDCARASSTVGAVALGLATFDPRVRIGGAILNRIASARHEATIRAALAQAGIAVLGAIPRDERIAIGSRHLGLDAPEGEAWRASVETAADAVERGVDLDALLRAAADTAPLPLPPPAAAASRRARIAIPRDEAFWFYDEASLEALEEAGAELVRYSPLRDPFPDVGAAFIGGGYPELHAAALAQNGAARDGLAEAIGDGMPAYAECGGLMYLGRSLQTAAGTEPMVGAVPAVSRMSERRSALRYVEARAYSTGPLFLSDQGVRGHEFHYSRTAHEHGSPAYDIDGEAEGYVTRTLHASYVHVHLAAHREAVQRFVDAAAAFGPHG